MIRLILNLLGFLLKQERELTRTDVLRAWGSILAEGNTPLQFLCGKERGNQIEHIIGCLTERSVLMVFNSMAFSPGMFL